MNTFREALDHVPGLRFVFEEMHFSTSVGRQALLQTPWMVSKDAIEASLDQLSRYFKYSHNTKGVEELQLYLSQVVNITSSIEVLKQKKAICSDIDLFEIKKLALLEERIRSVAEKHDFVLTEKPELGAVLEILDPKSERLPSFFLSGDFNPQLDVLRKQIKRADSDSELTELNNNLSEVEERTRAQITRELSAFADPLRQALSGLANDDQLFAKARWAKENKATLPKAFGQGETVLKELIHPEIARTLEDKNKRFQPVSISFTSEPTLISGANMGGKSVLLNAVALAQALMQFGFYVPASEAQLVIVDQLLYSVGDGADIKQGLSSFGAEMVRLNTIIKRAKEGIKILAIIDEPARTTNPEEGYALVSGLVKLLEKYSVSALIATHYSGVLSEGKRWRVRGFRGDKDLDHVDSDQLEKYMDYTLEPDLMDSVPQEAFRIAQLLGVDEEYLDLSKKSFRPIKNEK